LASARISWGDELERKGRNWTGIMARRAYGPACAV